MTPPPRLPWPVGFPDVVVQQAPDSPVRLKDQPGYERARRGGDIFAALEVVRALLDPRRLGHLQSSFDGAKPILVAVQAEEAGRNALPTAYAFELGRLLGPQAEREIVQINRTYRIGADSIHRLTSRGYFDGFVLAGQAYVIVDDVVTQGGTLADLRSYIERQGGKVLAATTLIGSTGSHRLALRQETLAALREGFGTAEAEYEGAFGHGYEGLTESEARAIIRLGVADAVRDRVIAPAKARLGSAARGAGRSGAEDGSRDGLTSQTRVAAPPPALPLPTFHPPPTVRDGAHHYTVRVYFEDTDAAGVVYYANYLRFAERARTEAMRELGALHADLSDQHGFMFMVRRAKLDYLGPARLDDSLVVVTRALSVGAASVELRQTFHRTAEAERSLVVVDIQLACVRRGDLRPVRIPPRWRAALATLSPS